MSDKLHPIIVWIKSHFEGRPVLQSFSEEFFSPKDDNGIFLKKLATVLSSIELKYQIEVNLLTSPTNPHWVEIVDLDHLNVSSQEEFGEKFFVKLFEGSREPKKKIFEVDDEALKKEFFRSLRIFSEKYFNIFGERRTNLLEKADALNDLADTLEQLKFSLPK